MNPKMCNAVSTIIQRVEKVGPGRAKALLALAANMDKELTYSEISSISQMPLTTLKNNFYFPRFISDGHVKKTIYQESDMDTIKFKLTPLGEEYIHNLIT